MAIVLGANRYGKAEVRLVHVERSTSVHVITDINVTSQLIGDFSDTHLTGANDKVIATDTQKNTAYALARTGGISSIEEYGLRLARNYVGTYLREEIASEGLTRNVPAFARFLEVAAACNGRMINKTEVANDAKVPRTTVNDYFEILKDTLIGSELEAWTRSLKTASQKNALRNRAKITYRNI